MSAIRERLLAAGINQRLFPALTLGAAANSQYSGNVSKLNDEVELMEVSNFSLTDYTGADLTINKSDPLSLKIRADKAQAFYEGINTSVIGNRMSQYIGKLAELGAYRFAGALDYALAEVAYAEGGIKDATNMGTAAAAIAKASIDNVLRYMAKSMADAGVPTQGRFLAVSPLAGMWLREKYVSVLNDRDPMARNGIIGNLEGFDVIEAPAIQQFITANGSTFTDATAMMVAGVRGQSLAYVDAVTQIKFGEEQNNFSEFVKGLMIYGVKVFRPDMTGLAFLKA